MRADVVFRFALQGADALRRRLFLHMVGNKFLTLL